MPDRIWIITELYYPEETSTGYFLTKIAEGLTNTLPVHVVCGQPTYSEHGIKAPAREVRNDVHINRMASTHFGKDRLLLRAINIVTLSIAVAWFGFRHWRRGDRILIVTNPPALPPIVGLIAKAKGIDAHLLVHDVYPEVLSATGFLSNNTLSYRLLDKFFAATLRQYRTIIVLGRDMAEVFAAKASELKDRILIIPNWGDLDEVVPVPQAANPFLAQHRTTASCIILFSGNIGRTHDIEIILEAARLLRDRRDVEFFFSGYGGKTDLISKAIADGELPNVRQFPRQPRTMLGPMLSCATAAIISFVDEMKGLSVPSRMYNILSAGTPIIAIADKDSELSLVVQEEDAGWILPHADPVTLAELIGSIAEERGREEAARRGANGRDAVARRYTFEAVIEKFRRLLAQEAFVDH